MRRLKCPPRRPTRHAPASRTRLLHISLALSIAVTVSAPRAREDPPRPPRSKPKAPASARSSCGATRSSTSTIPARTAACIDLANRLHVPTREAAVRAQLLFRPGERFEQRRIEETERNLRSLRFLQEPEVHPVRYHDGVVDLEIRSRDVWTMTPSVSFGRSGGANHTNIEFEDTNFLGFGKFVQAGIGSDVDRTTTSIEWRDPNVFGTSMAQQRPLRRQHGRRRIRARARAPVLFPRHALERGHLRRSRTKASSGATRWAPSSTAIDATSARRTSMAAGPAVSKTAWCIAGSPASATTRRASAPRRSRRHPACCHQTGSCPIPTSGSNPFAMGTPWRRTATTSAVPRT